MMNKKSIQSSITMGKEKKKSESLKPEIQPLKYSVGIDMSKDKFDSLISVIDSEQRVKVIASKQFANSKSGFKELQEWVGRKCQMRIPIVFNMEILV